MPQYMKDPVDYYNSHNIKPVVFKYNVNILSIHNGIPVVKSPILFEEGDSLDFKIKI